MRNTEIFLDKIRIIFLIKTWKKIIGKNYNKFFAVEFVK